MIISLVVAATTNHVIGKDNRLLWHLPNDLKFFKNITWAMPVVMGRRTFEAVGKPLTGRTNIVITRNNNWNTAGIKKVNDVQQAIKAASETDAKEMYVIGGGEIYKETLPIADKIYMTRVHATLEGDTFFPAIDSNQWKLVSNFDFPADDKHAYGYTFQLWQKMKGE